MNYSMNRPAASSVVSTNKSPSPRGRGLGGGGLGWLGVGALAAIATLSAPVPARAQVDCCCDQLQTVCVDRILRDSEITPCELTAETPKHVTDATKNSCEELQVASKRCCCNVDLVCREVGITLCNEDEIEMRIPLTEQCPQGRTAAQPPPTRPSWVTSVLGTELIPDNCRIGPQDKKNPCTVRDILLVVVNITKLMLGVMGSLALLMFTYGGLVWLTSAGNTERVSRGKTILTNAVFGILILLVSWSAVNLVVIAFSQGRSGLGNIGEIFSKPWTQGP